ncbi:MAG: MotA/TolQ/ExbB proton channel family protein [Ignavibacteriaceae bacterium]|nr:MotA/TolQ/ExbB proton channel family protein [Ignavibacteriaceae bacterium]
MDFLSIFLRGGFIMYPILLLSVLGVGIAIERYLVIRKARMNAPKFTLNIRNLLVKGDFEGAIKLCMQENTPTANMIKKGLKKIKFGHERVKEAIEDSGKQEITKLEKGLSILATIAGVAPLLGFLGTVTGMIGAFMKIQDLQGSASPSDLAGGIWEALLTTAFGLGVGIIALISYNYFVASVNKLVSQMETTSTDVLDTIEEKDFSMKNGNEAK